MKESLIVPSWVHALTLEPHVASIDGAIRAFLDVHLASGSTRRRSRAAG